MFGFLKRHSSEKHEERNRAFKEKYSQFRELLDRNHEVLETITELSVIKEERTWISLVRIRSKVTKAAVNVYKLIENLNGITDGKYDVLKEIFLQLERRVEGILDASIPHRLATLTIPVAHVNRQWSHDIGSKGGNLGEIINSLHLPVPYGEAVTVFCYQEFFHHNRLQEKINKEKLNLEFSDYQSLDQVSQGIRELIFKAEIPPKIEEALTEASERLRQNAHSPDMAFVVRSSAVGEDELDASFAGLYETVINPRVENLGNAYKRVIASKYSPRAIAYREQKGMNEELLPMGALIMELINPLASGILFTRNPATRANELIITAVWGLGKTAVDGTVDPDQYRVSRSDNRIIEKTVGSKDKKMILATPEGTRIEEVKGQLRETPCLNDEQILQLTRMGVELEEHFECPQDVEWALSPSGTFFIIQSRPLKMNLELSHLEDLYPKSDLLKTYPVIISNLSIASQGSASGKSLMIKSPIEMEKVEPGTVLFVPDTAPVLVRVLPRVSALVAEKGNATGHLAIIAREFRIPMVIGSIGPGEGLQSGTVVTVDAYKGSIFEGRVEPLLRMTASLRKNEKVAPPSPTQQILDEVLKYIAPLTLPDPKDPSFKPQSIQTFHDIIRFSHEKAITAMFEVNESRILKRGRTKHLVSSKVPLDIYLIDIGGGLKESHEGNKVFPEDITSLPMQYLYQGMTTEGVRWAGHIPIDFKGFVSVFANTMFDGSKFERRLGDRSYAIVSGNYVNFSSRLGYHFSILDAYVGPQTMDNYISFRFKGGAASIEKRVRRVQFIAEVLKRHGFWVDQNADLLNARVKRLFQPEMEKKLSMIGTLLGSVRQLDVTMHNEDMVKHYVDLFMQGDYSMGYGEKSSGTAP